MSATRPLSMIFSGTGCVVLMLLLASCTSTEVVQREAAETAGEALPLPYSLAFIIRGDGEYLYHDSAGNERSADADALAGAIRVAEKNPQAEVFIFHERPRSKFLFLFPADDGDFSYYRNGQLLARESYRRGEAESTFDTQVDLYRRHRSAERGPRVRMLLYFGHEIPDLVGEEDDAASADRPFTLDELAGALGRLTDNTTKFDGVVLSSCFNGTPHAIAALSPHARFVVASPDNLHLSYFELQPLERLELGTAGTDLHAFLKQYAKQTFERLTEDLQTAVSVAVYDVERVQPFLRGVDSVDRALKLREGRRLAPANTAEHCDCADNAAYALPGMSDGVDVFFRPARFGRSKQKQLHSGWQCWRELDRRPADP